MFNPIKEQVEKMMAAIQELKDAGNESDFISVSSGSPDREDRRRSQGDVPNISVETLNEMQRKIDSLGEELRQEFYSRFEEGDKKLERRITRTSEKIANAQENIQDKLEALQHSVNDDQEKIRYTLGQ